MEHKWQHEHQRDGRGAQQQQPSRSPRVFKCVGRRSTCKLSLSSRWFFFVCTIQRVNNLFAVDLSSISLFSLSLLVILLLPGSFLLSNLFFLLVAYS